MSITPNTFASRDGDLMIFNLDHAMTTSGPTGAMQQLHAETATDEVLQELLLNLRGIPTGWTNPPTFSHSRSSRLDGR